MAEQNYLDQLALGRVIDIEKDFDNNYPFMYYYEDEDQYDYDFEKQRVSAEQMAIKNWE